MSARTDRCVIPSACAVDAQNRKLLTRAGVAARPYTESFDIQQNSNQESPVKHNTAQAILIGKTSAVSARTDGLYMHPVEEKRNNLLLRFWLGTTALLLGWNRIGWNRFVFTTLGCPPNAIVANDPAGRSATC